MNASDDDVLAFLKQAQALGAGPPLTVCAICPSHHAHAYAGKCSYVNAVGRACNCPGWDTTRERIAKIIEVSVGNSPCWTNFCVAADAILVIFRKIARQREDT